MAHKGLAKLTKDLIWPADFLEKGKLCFVCMSVYVCEKLIYLAFLMPISIIFPSAQLRES